jgi:hypothetical protein
MIEGASSWFCNVSTYGGEVIEYWTKFSLNIHLNQNKIKYRGIWNTHSMILLKSHKGVGFNENDLEFLGVGDIEIWIVFLSLEIQLN